MCVLMIFFVCVLCGYMIWLCNDFCNKYGRCGNYMMLDTLDGLVMVLDMGVYNLVNMWSNDVFLYLFGLVINKCWFDVMVSVKFFINTRCELFGSGVFTVILLNMIGEFLVWLVFVEVSLVLFLCVFLFVRFNVLNSCESWCVYSASSLRFLSRSNISVNASSYWSMSFLVVWKDEMCLFLDIDVFIMNGMCMKILFMSKFWNLDTLSATFLRIRCSVC